MVFWVIKFVERDGFCRSVQLNWIVSCRVTLKVKKKKTCVRLPRIPDWHVLH